MAGVEQEHSRDTSGPAEIYEGGISSTHTHTHTYTHTLCAGREKSKVLSVYAHSYACAHTHMQAHTHMHTQARTHIYAHIHAHSHTHSHTHRHKYTHAHTHARTHRGSNITRSHSKSLLGLLLQTTSTTQADLFEREHAVLGAQVNASPETHIYLYVLRHAHTHTHMHTHAHTSTHTHTRTLTHIHTHMGTNTHTHTRTHRGSNITRSHSKSLLGLLLQTTSTTQADLFEREHAVLGAQVNASPKTHIHL